MTKTKTKLGKGSGDKEARNALYRVVYILFILVSGSAFEAFAVEIHEQLSDTSLESKAQEIGREIKCPTCHGQSIEDSNAEAASVLRQLVRQNVSQGRTKEEIFSFLSDVYGDAVLFDPPWSFETLVLWFFPFLFLIISFVIFMRSKKKKNF